MNDNKIVGFRCRCRFPAHVILNAAESSGTMEGNLTFRPLVPELSIDLHIVTKKTDIFTGSKVLAQMIQTSTQGYCKK